MKEMFAAMCDANENGTPKIGVYQASLSRAAKRKKGNLTTLTFQVNTTDVSPNDAMPWQRGEDEGGMVCWAFIGTVASLKKLGVE